MMAQSPTDTEKPNGQAVPAQPIPGPYVDPIIEIDVKLFGIRFILALGKSK